jgi:hypothetical protein
MRYKQSIKYEALDVIKSNFVELSNFYKKRWKIFFGELLINKNSFLVMIFFYLLVSVIYYLFYKWDINYDSIALIVLSYNEAVAIIDLRLNVLATIVGSVLIVIGFLVNNLAEKTNISFQILFRITYLFPIVFFSLSTLGYFLVISYLRSTINPYYFVQIIIFMLVMFILIIILIGFLFKNLISIVDPIFLINRYKKTINILSTRIILDEIVSIISLRLYQKRLQEINLNEIDTLDIHKTFSLKYYVISIDKRSFFLKDIRTNALSKFLEKIKKKHKDLNIEYMPLGINIILNYNQTLFSIEKNVRIEGQRFLKYFKFKDKEPEYFKQFSSLVSSLNEKVRYASNNNNKKNLDNLLPILEDIYDQFFLNLEHYRRWST